MSYDKTENLCSPHEKSNNDGCTCRTNSNASLSETTPTESTDKNINMNDFLDFLKVSCEVSGAGCSSHSTTGEINYAKLANNSLVNELFGHKSRYNRGTSKDSMYEDVQTEQSNPSQYKTFNTFEQYSSTMRKTEIDKNSGLHPKLDEKLNYVINEGVLDAVLPFICPVPVPISFANRCKRKESYSKTTVNVETNSNTETDKPLRNPEGNTTNTAQRTKEAVPFYRRKSKSNSNSTEKKEYNMPEVIIHVCDEVKNTSRDFSCPQALLVSKMGYFANVTAGQKLEDMDISVHCDIHIFDWLMKWVKSSAAIEQSGTSGLFMDAMPQLDAYNAVPILVSASFLQMEPLLLDCLSYCHAHLNEVVRSSTNLSCLNDSIITRLAAMFTNVELEVVRDKKERLTPRLWIKLIQSLCEPEPEALRGHYFSLSGLFRCSKCGKCLTNTLKTYINCLPSNIRLNRWGQLVSYHVRDTNWDMNNFILHLFKELKSWRRVYWKLWGHCHFLYCCHCEMYFPVYQMSWCRFHPESANFLGPVSEGCIAGPAGRYPCCEQQAFRFETLPGPNGCQYREHSVLVETDRERAVLSIAQLAIEGFGLCDVPPTKDFKVNSETEPHWSGISLTPQCSRQGLLPPLNPDESAAKIVRRTRHGTSYFLESATESDSNDTDDETPQRSKKYLSGTGVEGSTCHEYFSSSDGCESEYSGRKLVFNKKCKKRPTETPGRYWSGEVSARSNQDHQREFEEKVMKQVVAIVNKKTGSEHSLTQHNMPLGGTFVRLEAEWKEQLKQRGNISYSNSSSTTGFCKQKNK